MKTVLAFVGAFALGALLLYFGMSSGLVPTPGPTPEPTPEPTRTCPEVLGAGPRKAMVMVLWNKNDQCHLKTVPNRLNVCVGDELIWETSFIPRCNQYKRSLVIEVKPTSPGKNLVVESGDAEATGRFPDWPTDCVQGSTCFVEYKVTLDGPSGQLEEDPHIDIW